MSAGVWSKFGKGFKKRKHSCSERELMLSPASLVQYFSPGGFALCHDSQNPWAQCGKAVTSEKIALHNISHTKENQYQPHGAVSCSHFSDS